MPQVNKRYRGVELDFAGSAARTATGAGATQVANTGDAEAMRVQLNVTAASGTTPNLVVLIEDTLDGTNWNTIGTFAAKTAAGREVINITTPFADKVRASWTVTGTTPSFTFAIDGWLQ